KCLKKKKKLREKENNTGGGHTFHKRKRPYHTHGQNCTVEGMRDNEGHQLKSGWERWTHVYGSEMRHAQWCDCPCNPVVWAMRGHGRVWMRLWCIGAPKHKKPHTAPYGALIGMARVAAKEKGVPRHPFQLR